MPISITAILDFDHARSNAAPDRFSKHIKAGALAYAAGDTAQPCDITIDLSSATTVQRMAGPVLRPLYDGSPRDTALFHALLDRRAPHLTLWHSELPETFEIGTPALEHPSRLATSLDQTTSRLVEGIMRYFNGTPDALRAAGSPPPAVAVAEPASILVQAGEFLTLRTMRKARKLTDTFSGDAPRWHIAWRAIRSDNAIAPASLNLADYQILADDGARTYADPCIVVRDGVAHLFVAEMPEATGVGVIASTVLGSKEADAPRPIALPDADSVAHPFVFEHDGETWMMPSPRGGGVHLYRATRFPDKWNHTGQIIDATVHDATFFTHNGLLWIAAACDAYQSSTWDGLALFWSEHIEGPWHAHARNPVIIDATAARPAGALWCADERLYRPAQDCSGGIGSALTLNVITELTRDTFAETALGTLAFGRRLHLQGPHSLSRGGGFEVLDLCARPSALRAAFRAGYRAPIAL